MDIFSENVRALMKLKDIKGSQLGRIMGLSRQAINTLLSSKSAPTLTTVQRVATALNVPPFILLMTPQERAQWDAKALGQSAGPGLSEFLDRLSVSELEGALALKRALEASRKTGN